MPDTFTMDTSGAVPMSDPERWDGRDTTPMTWDDIGALPYGQLAQGYIEALFAQFEAENPPRFERHRLRFSDLHPDALARILKDCEDRRTRFSGAYDGRHTGARFWRERQAGDWQLYPPLTPFLNDEGRVLFKEAA